MQFNAILFQEEEAREIQWTIDFAEQGSQLSLTKQDAGDLHEALQELEFLKSFIRRSMAVKRWRSNPILVFGEMIARLGKLKGYWAANLAQSLQRRRTTWMSQRS
jgi:hypothetical protein